MTEIEMLVDPDGTVQFVHSDDLAAAFAGEDVRVRRASHVEPAEAFGWERDGWLADMRPVGGPLLHDGHVPERPGERRPFATRRAALDAELAWLSAAMAERKLEAR